MKKLIFIIFLSIVAFCNNTYSQVNTLDSIYKFTNSVNSQKTSNSKDILSNVFRASLANLLGDSKSLQFNSTLYGLDSLVNKNARSNNDKFYTKQRALRAIQINLSIKADSNTNQLTDFSGGLTIALINKRDITYANFSKEMVPQLDRFEKLRKDIDRKVAEKNPKVDYKALQKSWSDYDTSHDYKMLDSLIIVEINALDQSDQDFIKNDLPYKTFKTLTTQYARKSLLTISPDYAYSRFNKQSAMSFSAAYLVGLTNSIDKKPWELEAKASFSIGADTTISAANYKNKPFFISTGLNKVLRESSDKVSSMELKGFFQYDYQFGNLPPGASVDKVTFNTTLRINLYKSIWLPLTLSYDIKHANVLGFLSLTANIDK